MEKKERFSYLNHNKSCHYHESTKSPRPPLKKCVRNKERLGEGGGRAFADKKQTICDVTTLVLPPLQSINKSLDTLSLRIFPPWEVPTTEPFDTSEFLDTYL